MSNVADITFLTVMGFIKNYDKTEDNGSFYLLGAAVLIGLLFGSVVVTLTLSSSTKTIAH